MGPAALPRTAAAAGAEPPAPEVMQVAQPEALAGSVEQVVKQAAIVAAARRAPAAAAAAMLAVLAVPVGLVVVVVVPTL